MLKAYLKSRNRGVSLALLLVICCAAAARTPQERESLDQQAWPKEIVTAGGRIVVYQPQLETFKGNRLTTRAAVSVMKTGSAPVFGGVWMEATLFTDAERRTAKAVDVRVTEIRFPNTGAAEVARLRREIAAEIPRWNLVYRVDTLIAELRVLEERRALAQGLKADVPEIHFRSHPAVLLTIQGEPAWRAVEGTSYRRLENSVLFVLQDEAGTCTLHVPPFWWTAKSPLGPWRAVDDVPEAVAEIWRGEPKPQLPPSDPGQEAPQRPEVIVASGPAELVWTDGPPRYAPIAGTDLLYVTNTESDVFLHISTQFPYVLLSGRWYRTPYSTVAWEFVPADQLPSDFARIPLSSEKQHVLACVAGTPQARDALLDAEIPQTEGVQTGPAPDLVATYDGDPRFEEISGSSVQYAVNTSCSIFSVQRRYYWCQTGIWYDSDCAVGPWYVCTWVPPAIYLIPPSCPYYYVTYCRIFSVTPRIVYVGYYPGYRGCYVWGRSVVYGTGWWYPCWTGNVWYPSPVTWGVGVRYSPVTCGWGVRVGSGYASLWGLRRPSTLCDASVQAGVGGLWGGVTQQRIAVESTRQVYDRAPVAPDTMTNPYARQPGSFAPSPSRPPDRAKPEGPVANPGGNTPPRGGSDDGRNNPPNLPPPGRREAPRAPTSPQAPSEAAPSPHRTEGPRTPQAPREIPRTPPQPFEHRDGPRNLPPPPFREEREAPRTPPPPPRHEAPRDPAPPPRERREDAPRNPPPPPPPPRERRDEGPRNPPPPRERRDDGPRNPPPPPPRERRDEGPRNPPPPPPPPPRREEPKEPPRAPERRRSAPPAPVRPASFPAQLAE